jgi:hypothetical protein
MTGTPPAEEEEGPSPRPTGLAQEDLGERVERADIPGWLQRLRPRSAEAEQAGRDSLETEGLLKGLHGVIPASAAIGAPSTPEGLPETAASEVGEARAELLQSLLGQPSVMPQPEARGGETGVAELTERRLVAGLLLLAVVGMLLAPLVTSQPPKLTRPIAASGSAASQLHQVIDRLEPADEVMVAFEYGPPEAGELSAVARPVLEHVNQQGPNVSIVSTRPGGPLVAAQLMSEIAHAEDWYSFLGYRPGAATAVSQLLVAVDRMPTLLLILADRPAPLRRWVEQDRALYDDQLPVAVVGSAALEPAVSPYLHGVPSQVAGAIYGLRGAASYEALRRVGGDATQRLDALAAGHIAILVLVVIGAVVHGLARIGKRQG